jgi:hypothetical protein
MGMARRYAVGGRCLDTGDADFIRSLAYLGPVEVQKLGADGKDQVRQQTCQQDLQFELSRQSHAVTPARILYLLSHCIAFDDLVQATYQPANGTW